MGTGMPYHNDLPWHQVHLWSCSTFTYIHFHMNKSISQCNLQQATIHTLNNQPPTSPCDVSCTVTWWFILPSPSRVMINVLDLFCLSLIIFCLCYRVSIDIPSILKDNYLRCLKDVSMALSHYSLPEHLRGHSAWSNPIYASSFAKSILICFCLLTHFGSSKLVEIAPRWFSSFQRICDPLSMLTCMAKLSPLW